MAKLDFKKSEKAFFSAPAGAFIELDLPERRYLMIDGAGDPNASEAYKLAMEALFTTAYTLKFASKKQLDTDYVVPPPESLWWGPMDQDVWTTPKAKWLWSAMLMVPDFTPDAMVRQAIAMAAKKKPCPAFEHLRLAVLKEAHVVQTLHIGSYQSEGPLLRRLHEDYLPAHGLRAHGRHHEIYLSDPRKTAPEKCRTLLRHPVAPM